MRGAVIFLSMVMLVAGCDEYDEPEVVEAPATVETKPSSTATSEVDDAMNVGRSSTLGRARDTAESTASSVEQYNRELEKALDDD